MLKSILNEAVISFHITAIGPLLIKKGKDQDNTMRFVKDSRDQIYLPGSSIRGVCRSWCERIARTIGDPNIPLSCDPLNDDENSVHCSCSKRLEKDKKEHLYRDSCPICKIFGTTRLGSRLRIGDAYPVNGAVQTNLPERAGISISRFTGGVKHGPFKLEYILDKTFATTFTLRNFELWHLGLLAFLFRDFSQKRILMGSGKTRGFGQVQGKITGLSVSCIHSDSPPIASDKKLDLDGLGKLYKAPDSVDYDFAEEESIKGLSYDNMKWDFPRAIYSFTAEQADELFRQAAPYWAGQEGGYYLKAMIKQPQHVKEVDAEHG